MWCKSVPLPPLQRNAARGKLLRPLRVAQQEQTAVDERPELVPGIPGDEDDREPMDIDALNQKYGIPGVIEFGWGQGDLPTVLLTHPQTEMKLVVYLYGATIAQWLKSDGTATFYDGPDELYQEGLPLRTGVSVVFPQHRDGLLPAFGFADSMMWEVEGAGIDCPEMFEQLAEYWRTLQLNGVISPEKMDAALNEDDEGAAAEIRQALDAEGLIDGMVDTDMAPSITLRLRDTPETRRIWPHRFELLYKITLMTQEPLTKEEEREIIASRGVDPDEAEALDEAQDDEFMRAWNEAEAEAEAAEEAEVDGEVVAGRSAPDRGEEAAEAAEEGEEAPAAKRRARAPRDEASAGAGEGEDGVEEEEGDEYMGDVGDDDAWDDEDEQPVDGSTMGQQPIGPYVQIKQEFWVHNRGG
ncbi:hypothetical protein GPECTOR_108g186 [Gonium pectorale]|uniref:Uncharacterized protein n=1 Tax=Gonium pectorale TaxID=33097 RepID=A0A150FZF7_GONPE|nr:hypothetical protein GPECTOR_108g186 [Gonium pectorale]|eukprot:KXZ42991.1 hypothetical protein GPECTOR_108g186 [Gonium pectorale]